MSLSQTSSLSFVLTLISSFLSLLHHRIKSIRLDRCFISAADSTKPLFSFPPPERRRGDCFLSIRFDAIFWHAAAADRAEMDQSSKKQPLGVKEPRKSIRKGPLRQKRPPQPQVYNVSKSDFRSFVQQLTGSPPRNPSGTVNIPVQSRPPQAEFPSSRLMRSRPPPLAPISSPPLLPSQISAANQNHGPNLNLNNGLYQRPSSPSTAHVGAAWADAQVSAYMRYLESSLLGSDSTGRAPTQGFLPSPNSSGNPPPSVSSVPASLQPRLLPSPGSQFTQLSPRSQVPLPNTNSLLPFPSPSSFLNHQSPKSPYPLLSPGIQNPQPFTSNFFFSSMHQSGTSGPGPGSQPLPSPSILFPPSSPTGFLPLQSPRWRKL